MTRLKKPGYEQFLQENLMWDRSLDLYLQQNALLKTRLSQLVDLISNKEFVSQAEQFQNSFLHTDDSIRDLQLDINLLQNNLKEIDPNEIDENMLTRKHSKLRNEINNFEKNFSALKNEFSQYMNLIGSA